MAPLGAESHRFICFLDIGLQERELLEGLGLGLEDYIRMDLKEIGINTRTNDKVDNEMIPEAVHRKPLLGDRLMKGLCDQISPQMGSLSS